MAKRLSITLTDAQAAALERIAEESGATKQSIIGLAISAWVAEHDRDETRPTYQRAELLAYLGEYAGDYDVDAIERDATEYEPRTGRRVWTVGHDELAEICDRHDKALLEQIHAEPGQWVAYARMWSPAWGDGESCRSTHETEGEAIAAAQKYARQARRLGWMTSRPMWYQAQGAEDMS